MSLLIFAKMKSGDQATYVDNMVEGAAKILKDQGHPDQSEKLIALFFQTGKGGGTYQFIDRLKYCDSNNRKNAINPNNRKPVLQVEDAMELLLKDNGMIIPAKDLIPINAHFMPAVPKIIYNPEDGPATGAK